MLREMMKVLSELLKLLVLYFSVCYESEHALFLVLYLTLIYAMIKTV
jgi:hypothetical protein